MDILATARQELAVLAIDPHGQLAAARAVAGEDWNGIARTAIKLAMADLMLRDCEAASKQTRSPKGRKEMSKCNTVNGKGKR